MGLFQKALETYDAMEKFAGVYAEGQEPLAPIAHIVTKAQIEITIDVDGRFVAARAADKDQKIIIPVTEKSVGRTSTTIAPHPLCEKLKYLLDQDKKYEAYIEQLSQWVNSPYGHPKAKAVLEYVQKRTIESDLKRFGVLAAKDDAVVCWKVIGQESDESAPVWTDISLMKAYSAYYLSQKEENQQICMLTGENASITWQHLKGVFSLNGNAKIISANDSANFTYRGRFTESGEAASMGYLASQKAHNALKWLISNQGTIQGGRAFVCWNPQGKKVPQPMMPFFAQLDDDETDLSNYKSYREDLRRKIAGYCENWTPSEQVVIAAFDAATTGRLAITYYNELLGSDFMERLAYWDETCCWKDAYKGVRSPLLYQIIAYAFGTQKGKDGKVEPDEKIVAPQMQRLLSCRIDQAAFPLDIMRAIVAKAEQMQNYTKNRNTLLFTACAVIRKYYIDHQKEAFDLALEPKRNDRSYQWGRLLAVMEKIERDTYDAEEKRETNAIRMQTVFVRRPAYAFKIVMEQLKNAYYPRLSMAMRIYYDRLISEIMEQLSQDIDNYGKPLAETYLLGYYLQKSALYTKKDATEMEEHDDEV